MTDIEILMADNCTRQEAERHLKNGTIIYDGEDLKKNLESYLNDWPIEEEYKEDYRRMVNEKIPVGDWGIVERGGETWYIEYAL